MAPGHTPGAFLFEVPYWILLLKKSTVLRFVRRWTLPYVEIFNQLRSEGGRSIFPSRSPRLRQNFASYVLLYDDERKPGISVLLGLLGEHGFKELNAESASWSSVEVSDFIEEISDEAVADELVEGYDLLVTEEDWKRKEEAAKALSEEELTAGIRQVCFFGGVFAHLFNVLVLMTHGAKLTTLVPFAVQGDDDAFPKAVQVDRLLLTHSPSHYPYFIARKQRAQDEGDQTFLSTLNYRVRNLNLKREIRYPTLHIVFGLLDLFDWLDKLPHKEILDLCKAISLDRFQNRIEDAREDTIADVP